MNLKDEIIRALEYSFEPKSYDALPPMLVEPITPEIPENQIRLNNGVNITVLGEIPDDTVLLIGPPDREGNIVPERCGMITGIKP